MLIRIGRRADASARHGVGDRQYSHDAMVDRDGGGVRRWHQGFDDPHVDERAEADGASVQLVAVFVKERRHAGRVVPPGIIIICTFIVP